MVGEKTIVMKDSDREVGIITLSPSPPLLPSPLRRPALSPIIDSWACHVVGGDCLLNNIYISAIEIRFTV